MDEGIRFTKMHGCGNDFILIDEYEYEVVPESRKGEFSRVLCRRRLGIGADGVIFVCKPGSNEYDARMRIFNADGTEAEMSGNGMRCFAKYVYEHGLVHSRRMKIETLSGMIIPEVEECINGKVATIRVFMGKPRFERMDAPLYVNARIGELKLTAINLGNPHAVIIVRSFDALDLDFVGRSIESHPAFPNRTNVDFVVPHPGENEISVRTFERGVGETLSCGTGSTASVLALNELGLINPEAPVTVHTMGGDLRVELKDEGAYLIGPAEEVFVGTLTLSHQL